MSVTNANDWVHVDRCPACASTKVRQHSKISKNHYLFCGTRVQIPAELRIIRCICGLAFKNLVPSPAWLSDLTASSQASLWAKTYTFHQEREILKSHFDEKFSVIDLGAAGGEFLNAMKGITSRRSALDIIRFERLECSPDGEFIEAFLDDEEISWSGVQYDAVTAFDVFEHFYRPRNAFRNLAKLVSLDGIVLLETGDADTQVGLGQWYYTSLFEHHLFWTPASLRSVAEAYGFRVEHCVRKRHKTAPSGSGLKQRFMRQAYLTNPGLYHSLQTLAGADGSIPPVAGQADHMQVVLRRTR